MKTEIILTHDWTHPETGETHKAGDRIMVDAAFVRADAFYGLAGKYTFPELVPAPVPARAAQPKAQTTKHTDPNTEA
jgi:hypothetical protein